MKVIDKPVLLVDDDQMDALTVIRALREIQVPNKVVHRESGGDAMNYLEDEASAKPCIILLDLNMPGMNGIEFLKAVKSDARFRRIPVVMLTASDEQQDKLDSFNLGVAGYIPKQADYRRFVEVIKAIDAYWTISEMPENL